MDFAHSFQSGHAELERLNRAYIVLIPKRPGATMPDVFPPICLQNCPLKIVGKMLTTGLQNQIGMLIDIDQTGFPKGRSISENFIYAMELVQCCYKQKAATHVLKLDFAKAFDSINWAGLMKILQARGFPDQWCTWILSLLETAKSAILVSGLPWPLVLLQAWSPTSPTCSC